MLLANNFGYVADNIFTVIPSDLTSASAWLGVIAYTFQIYFDFSGYSDMAIGLGSIFGFRIMENFNFPYISRSIKEFWRRWHISLSTWFRDYLYIPLGGNRLGTRRTYINLIIVFFLTGLWHGASWNFVAWGLLHGFFLVLERLGGDRLLQKLWKPFQHIYTLAVVVFAWVLFRADDFQYAWGYYKAMLGLNDSHSGMYEIAKFMNPEFMVVLIIGTLASVMVFKKLRIYIDGFLSDQHGGRLIAMQSTFTILMILFYFGLFVLCSMYLLSNTYNPFIYYRF